MLLFEEGDAFLPSITYLRSMGILFADINLCIKGAEHIINKIFAERIEKKL